MYFFSKKSVFFEIFEMYLPTIPQKSLFIAFLLTNFEKSAQKFFAVPSASRAHFQFCPSLFGAFGATKTALYTLFSLFIAFLRANLKNGQFQPIFATPSALHIQRNLPIVMVQNQRCCTER